ncbi:M15 family metallopeptidase [Streptomyces sp. NPDC091272]|uniref:M15 family metallopeptidase n=1 Tax=Streptomyces sp. NPDC091272 TaxID=3365981 RepID=UPI003811FA0E
MSIRMRFVALALPLALSVPVPACGHPSATGERPARAEATAPPPAPALSAVVSAVPGAKLRHTLRPGCPVPARDLRLIRMNHWDFDGRVQRGELIVRASVVKDVTQVFGKMFAARFPIRRMRVMAHYRGDDEAAMADDNTSAFNCRRVTGDPSELSRHSYGDAVDINTVENPYVDANGVVHPAAGRKYLRRDRPVKGMIRRGDAVTTSMAAVGWLWGGRWPHPDYQHFSATGQ